MIYALFMRKTQGDINPFPTTFVIQKYIHEFVKKTDIVITFPGYMSTTPKTIDDFITDIKLPQNTYFTEGINGSTKLSTHTTIQDEHNRRFKLKLGSPIPSKKDHAKMMFFLENGEPIDHIEITQLLQMNVKAILLGSSNQSKLTYFNKIADKGEADIFLIDGKYLTKDETINANKEMVEDKLVMDFYEDIINEKTEYIDSLIRNISLFKEFNSFSNMLNNIFVDTIKQHMESR